MHIFLPLQYPFLCLPTAYVVREEVIFSVCLSVHTRGGYPIQLMVGGVPNRADGGGVPHPADGGGVPHPADGGGYPIQLMGGTPFS